MRTMLLGVVALLFSATLVHAQNLSPTVTLRKPNGGELWNEDHLHLVLWEATDDDSVTRVDILYSPDGGANYVTVRDSLPNDGRFRWRIPRNPTAMAKIKVVAYDAEGLSAEDESDGIFTINDVSTHVLSTGAVSHTIRNDGWTGALGGTVGATVTTNLLSFRGSPSEDKTFLKKSRPESFTPVSLPGKSKRISGAGGGSEPSLEFPPGSGNNHLYLGQLLFAFVDAALDTFAVRLYGDEFLPMYPIEVYPEPDFVETWTGYTDRLEINIDVEEATFTAANEPFVIQEFILYNYSGETYSNFYVAGFADFDISDHTWNLSGYDEANRLAYMYNPLGDWGYAGIRVMDKDPSAFRRWGGGVVAPITRDQVYRALSAPGFDDPSADSPGDYRVAEIMGPVTIPPDDSLTVAFALVAGEDLAALQEASRRAQAFWNEINEVTPTISGEITYPGHEANYTNGELYIDVWQDPSFWPFPPEGPVTSVVIGPPVDFMTPLPYLIDDPVLQPGHDYYVAATFDEDITVQPPTPEAEFWYPDPIDLSAGPATGIDLPLTPIGPAGPGLWLGAVGPDFIELMWDRWPDPDNEFNRYEIHRSTAPGVTLADPTVLNEPDVNVTSWRDNNVTEGQDYYYKLWMFDQAGIRYETMEVWATPGAAGHVEGTISSSESGFGDLVVGLFEPENDEPWSPNMEVTFPGLSFPGDIFYVFDGPGIYDAFGWEVRAFLDENQNFLPDPGEMRGRSSEFEIVGGTAYGIDFTIGYPPTGTGSISGNLVASQAADGEVYLALWFPGSDPEMDPPDITQPTMYVNFPSPGSVFFYEFTDLADGNGYTVGAFLDQAGSPNTGPGECDAGEDLAGVVGGINISGGAQVTNQDIQLEDCSQFKPGISISDAVDNQTLEWISGGDQPWFGQRAVTHDGNDAAQSGAIGDNGDSWLDADIDIGGPGTVNFWWKVSSQQGGDFLRLYVNDEEIDAISGEVNWQEKSFNVCGYAYVSWSYEKNGSGAAGSDAGWLDEVTVTPGLFGMGEVSPLLDEVFLVGEAGDVDTVNLGFENIGDGPVVITGVSSSEPGLFYADPDWIDLPEYVCPGDPWSVRMLLSPSAEGTYAGNITFELNNATSSTYTVPFTIEVFGAGGVTVNTGTVFFQSQNDTTVAPQGTGVSIDLTGLSNIWDVDDPYLQVTMVDGSVPPGNPAGDMGMAVATRYWEIFTNLPPGFSTDICFDLSDPIGGGLLEGIDDFLALKVLRRPVYSDGSWTFITNVTYDEETSTVCAIAQTEFSQWTVGGDSSGVNFTPALPVISGNIQNLTAQESQDFPLQVNIEAEAGVERARLDYFIGGAPSRRQTPFSLKTGTTYEAVIPANDVTNRGLIGYVGVRDSLGREVTSDTVGIQVQFGSIPFSGTQKEEYVMISVPGDLDDRNQIAVLGDELGEYDKTQWRLFRWNGTGYTEFEGNASFGPGEAYWIITRDANSLSAGAGKSPQLIPPFPLSLSQGWNQVGTPHNFDVNLEQLIVTPQGAIEPAFYEYDPSANDYRTTTTMKPGQGYWVYAFNDASVRVGPPSLGLARLATAASEEIPLEWGGTLKASAGQGYVEDAHNVFGVAAHANAEWDRWDRHEPPVIGDYVSLAFDATGWKERGGFYRQDIRQVGGEGYEWPVVVRTNQKGYVHLDLEWSGGMLPGWEAYLVDKDVGVARDLSRRPGYLFASNGTERPRHFVLVVGPPSFAQKKVDEYVAVPEEYRLFQNMPNPFNAVTTIRFSLPEESDVTLVVYDVLGHEVTRLISGEITGRGMHVVLWDGKDASGAPVSSGVYVYRLVARTGGVTKFQTAKKLILLK
ncbi:MAG: FlgD immunoglobulin-like domain containing protein [Fidelibacterota bacterium]